MSSSPPTHPSPGAAPDPVRTAGVAICADDLGLSPGVSDGIMELIAAGRLTATSVMVPGGDFARVAGGLAALRRQADIGLHLTLTDRAPLGAMPGLAPAGTFPPIGTMIRRALARQLPVGEIEAEIRRQIMGFAEATGFLPDFVDGHQHVHVLPGVRAALLAALRQCGVAPGRVWVRDCTEAVARLRARGVAIAKAAFIGALSRGMARDAAAAGHGCNDGFAGVYDFALTPPFRQRMQRFLTQPGPRPLIMVHPGHVDAVLPGLDPVVEARALELRYLAGAEFPADLAAAGLRLERISAMLAIR